MKYLDCSSFEERVKLFCQLYPDLYNYKSVSDVCWQESDFDGFYTILRLKDITIEINHIESYYENKNHHKIITWDRVSSLLLYVILTSVEEFGKYKNGGTVMPHSCIIDNNTIIVDNFDINMSLEEGHFFVPTKFPTENTLSRIFEGIIASKNKKITIVFKNYNELEKSALYIPITKPFNKNGRAENIKRLADTAFIKK